MLVNNAGDWSLKELILLAVILVSATEPTLESNSAILVSPITVDDFESLFLDMMVGTDVRPSFSRSYN